MSRLLMPVFLIFVLVLSACGGTPAADETAPGTDLGTPDIGMAPESDIATPDTGMGDMTTPDTGMDDIATPDTGMGDMETPDTGMTEDETPNTGLADETPDTGMTEDETAPVGTDPGVAGGDDIVSLATADGRFTTLITVLEAAGLAETLQGEGPFTVLAPTDDAFAALSPEDLDALLADPDALSDVLLYHVVDGEALSSDVVITDALTTLQGETISVTVDGETVLLNDIVEVTETDILASNGVIHVIDTVLLPPTLQ